MSNIKLFERQIPIRAIPQKDLDLFLDTEFKFWIATLLGLKEDKEDSYDITKDAIKKECIGMGFSEIKKMFEMYVDHKLYVKPIPNYFDRILFGKIVDAYINQKPKKVMKIEEEKLSKEEKINVMESACERIEKQYLELGEITDKCDHVYDYLFDLGKLPNDEIYKKAIFAKATLMLKSQESTKAGLSLDFHRQLKKTLQNIDNGSKKSDIVSISKKLVLEEYYNKL